jgi:peptidyl-prolyl cis-trans isomerase A (cyclophilin A)
MYTLPGIATIMPQQGRTMLTTCLACLVLIGLFAVTGGGGAAAAADAKDKPVVVLDTSMGKIAIELDRGKAPVTVDNFLKYVDDGFYDGTIFHRVIPGFMIQGGGYSKDAKSVRDDKPTRDTIVNEGGNGLKNLRGTIAMARKPDPNSATAQFFINHKDNAGLDRENPNGDGFGYAVFGKVIEGMDVVDKIAKVETTSVGGREGFQDYPSTPVIIKSAKRKGKS